MIVLILLVLGIIFYGGCILHFVFAIDFVFGQIVSVCIAFFPLVSGISTYCINRKKILIILNWILYYILGLFSILIILSTFWMIIRFFYYISIQNSSIFSIQFWRLDEYCMPLIITSILLSLYGMKIAYSPVVKRVRIKPSHILPQKSIKIVQISDIHISYLIGKNFVNKILNLVNNESPDIIVFTGDLLDGNINHFIQEIGLLKNLKAKYGKYFVTGNHEYFNKVEQASIHLEQAGFTILTNHGENIVDLNIYLGGVPDISSKRFKNIISSPELSIRKADSETYKILLAHQPKSFLEGVKAGYDLVLSGHTHGGQYFPGKWFVQLDQPYVSGVYHYLKGTLYVSEGTGFWGPPLRLGTKSEIMVLTIG